MFFFFLCNCIKVDFILSVGLIGFFCEFFLFLRFDWVYGVWGFLVIYWILFINWIVWFGGIWVVNYILSFLFIDSFFKIWIILGFFGICFFWKFGLFLGILNKGMYICNDEIEMYDFFYKKNKV